MRAFVLRMTPAGVDWVPEALASDHISIGWGHADELMDPSLDYWQFREVVKRVYYPAHPGYQQAGSTAGMLWLFLREMSEGDHVVVPAGGQRFYVASIRGDALFLPDKAGEHTAFRRPVEWLNGKQPIPRRNARAALQSRMKITPSWRAWCRPGRASSSSSADATSRRNDTRPPSPPRRHRSPGSATTTSAEIPSSSTRSSGLSRLFFCSAPTVLPPGRFSTEWQPGQSDRHVLVRGSRRAERPVEY